MHYKRNAECVFVFSFALCSYDPDTHWLIKHKRFFIHNKNKTTSQNIVNTKNDLEEALCSSGLRLTLIQLSRMITEDWGNAVFRPVNYAHLCRKVFSFNLGILYICSKLVDSHRNMQYPIT